VFYYVGCVKSTALRAVAKPNSYFDVPFLAPRFDAVQSSIVRTFDRPLFVGDAPLSMMLRNSAMDPAICLRAAANLRECFIVSNHLFHSREPSGRGSWCGRAMLVRRTIRVLKPAADNELRS
jgi:hypothetical protein